MGRNKQKLQHVGLGVAMGNAEEEVKKAADHVTTSVDEAGILNALREMRIV